MSQEQIRIRELETAVEANRTLLALESERAKRVQHQLVCIGQELGGEQFDQLLKGHMDNDLPPEELAAEIVSIVKAKLGNLQSNPDIQPGKVANPEIESLKLQLDTQTKRAAKAEGQAAECQNQATSFERSLNDARQKIQELEAALQALRNPAPPEDFPAWLEGWKKRKCYDRDWAVLEVIGRTGLARVKQIEDTLSAQGKLKPETTLRAIKDCCREDKLLDCDRGRSFGGRPTDNVTLTDKGRWVYAKLAGKYPLPSEIEELNKTIQNDFHGRLVLRVADHFTRLGYSVNTNPGKINIEENRYFWPDLVANRDGETCYLEVESGKEEDRATKIRKWENALLVGGGRIYLVARKFGSMNAIQSQIVSWATENGKKGHLFATNLEMLNSIQPGESPWARVREL